MPVKEDRTGYLRSISQEYEDGSLEEEDTYEEKRAESMEEENEVRITKEEGMEDTIQWK